MHAIERVLAPLGRRVDEASPLCDARLADGSRVNVVIPPLSLSGPCLTVRRFRPEGFSLRQLVANGTMPAALAELLAVCVAARASVLVSGGIGVGQDHDAQRPVGRDPRRAADRHDRGRRRAVPAPAPRGAARGQAAEPRGPRARSRSASWCATRCACGPTASSWGRCAGPEALDMLQALTTGHDGSLTTVHANSPEDALRRVETLALMAGVGAAPRRGARPGRRARSTSWCTRRGCRTGRAPSSRSSRWSASPAAPACESSTAASARRLRRALGGPAGRAGRAPAAGGADVSAGRRARRGRRGRGRACAARPDRPRARCAADRMRCGASPVSWTSWSRSAARGATRARPSGGGCCWPAPGVLLMVATAAFGLASRGGARRPSGPGSSPACCGPAASAFGGRSTPACRGWRSRSPTRSPEGTRCTRAARGHSFGGRGGGPRAAPGGGRARARRADRRGARGAAQPRALAAARHAGRGLRPAAARRRRPRPAAARDGARDGGAVAAGGGAARGHRAGALHGRAGRRAAARRRRRWPSSRAPAGSPACGAPSSPPGWSASPWCCRSWRPCSSTGSGACARERGGRAGGIGRRAGRRRSGPAGRSAAARRAPARPRRRRRRRQSRRPRSAAHAGARARRCAVEARAGAGAARPRGAAGGGRGPDRAGGTRADGGEACGGGRRGRRQRPCSPAWLRAGSAWC